MTTRLPSPYDPLRGLAPLRDEFDRLLRSASTWGREAIAADGWSPKLDIEETDDSYALHVEMPGVKTDDIDVSIEDGLLTIEGSREFYDEKEEDGFHRVEREFGRFHRAVRLPGNIDADRMTAKYTDGILTVDVPKAENARPHRIQVTSD